MAERISCEKRWGASIALFMDLRHVERMVGLVVYLATAVAARAEHRTWPATTVWLEGGDWKVAADLKNTGRAEEWWKGPVKEARPARVPGIMQESLPGYHGVAWYWREFTAPKKGYADGRCLLRFEAVDYLADVWVNDVPVGGHEGGETPFTLDITGAVKADAANRLAVRVLNPTAQPIDGIALAETPHRNKVPAGIGVGGSYNSGGITEPVKVFWTPAVRIDDVYVRPDWRSGSVQVQVTLSNASPGTVSGQVQLVINEDWDRAGTPVARTQVDREIPAGSSQVGCQLSVPQHRLWGLEEPCLYRLTTRLSASHSADIHETAVRFGFRELRVERGYFRLNGKRIFLKSSHTGNHCPIGAVVAPDGAPDLLRKDLLYMKSAGFNTVRFISGMAHPYQLELCDEIGLMVYEENLAAWLLADSPKMAERFDANLREMILRDRNHPSVVIFGLVNEMPNGPMVKHAVASLSLLRSLDDSRLVLQQSGRWDGQYNIGSICNPGSTRWEYAWGVEGPEHEGTARGGPWGGYFVGAGDAHIYPSTPHTPSIEAGIRNLGKDSKPVFLSEYGIGSLMNAIRELRHYEQNGANPEADDFKFFKLTEDKLIADWTRLGMNAVYAFPEEMLRASQQKHCRQRELGFSLIRSNPNICGYNLTGLLDHGYTGEGLWTFWREFKPGIMDTLQDGWAPLRWCLFAAPMHAYTGRPVKLEAVLANEDVLKPGVYPARLRVLGPDRIAWDKRVEVVIPQPASGDDGPLAVPVLAEDVTITGPAGVYEFAATLERGGAPAAGRLKLHVSEPPGAVAPVEVAVVAVDPMIRDWLKNRGVSWVPLEKAPTTACQVILVGNSPEPSLTPDQRVEVLQRVACGSVAVFLDPGVFRKDKDPVAWLPLKNKGRLTEFSDWLYHKECVARNHSFFDGLAPQGIMDWDYYGPLISNRFFEGQDTPEDVAAAAFAICHSSRPDGHAAGVMLGAYQWGAGKIVLNTFNLVGNLDKHPAADRLVLNVLVYAAKSVKAVPVPLPSDLDSSLKAAGAPSGVADTTIKFQTLVERMGP